MTAVPQAFPDVPPAELLAWLRLKASDAAKALRAREQMAVAWRSGSQADWVAASRLHPSTVGAVPARAARQAESARQDRIADSLRRDVAMYQAAIARLERDVASGA